jgi:hypothetical protein
MLENGMDPVVAEWANLKVPFDRNDMGGNPLSVQYEGRAPQQFGEITGPGWEINTRKTDVLPAYDRVMIGSQIGDKLHPGKLGMIQFNDPDTFKGCQVRHIVHDALLLRTQCALVVSKKLRLRKAAYPQSRQEQECENPYYFYHNRIR